MLRADSSDRQGVAGDPGRRRWVMASAPKATTGSSAGPLATPRVGLVARPLRQVSPVHIGEHLGLLSGDP